LASRDNREERRLKDVAEKVREKHYEPPMNADKTILFNLCLSVFIGGLNDLGFFSIL
jgi:hypothetical protein